MSRRSLAPCHLVAIVFSLALLAPCAAQERQLVVMETSAGKLTLELFADKAPLTVKNFLQYVDERFYDGTVFHRVIDNFMIQGGGMDTNLKEKRTRPPIRNEARNGLSNQRGTLAMARTADPHSATVQFYINLKDNSFLDEGKQPNAGYTVFGRVVEGMDVVDKIRKVRTGNRGIHQNVPVEPVVIRTLRRAMELTVVLGGSFAQGKRFTISAYVDSPIRGQALKLELPPGVQLLEGKEVQPVPAAPTGTSLVVWQARALRPGAFEVRVSSNLGGTRTQTVHSSAPRPVP